MEEEEEEEDEKEGWGGHSFAESALLDLDRNMVVSS